MSDTKNYRWTILGVSSFCALAFAITLQNIPPILRTLVDVLHISYAEAGALMSLYTLPAIFLSLPGGMLVDRYGPKIVGGTSLLTMALGTVLVAVGDSYWVLGLGRLITGAGAAVLMVVAPRAITSWFYRREIGLSMGIFNIAVPLGVILSLNFTGLIAHLFHWRASVLTSLAVVVAALCLFLILYRNQNGGERVKADSPSLLSVLKEAGWGIWLVGLSWALFNAGILSFFTYAPDYFMAQGKGITEAGLLASYPMWGSIVLAPVAGIFIDRTGQRRLLVSVGCAGMAILLYLIPVFPAHAGILAISMGVFMALLTPAIFSFPAALLPESVIGFGFGIVNTALGVGIAVGPYVAGGLRDATGNYLWSFTAMAIFVALGVIPMLLLRRQIGKNR